MAWISAVFFCLGAADTLLGDRLGLGSAFRQGFAAVVDLLLLMTGFMALAPWLGTHLAPVITPVFSAVGCDPSLFASLFLSCDAGGAVLAAQIAQEPVAGLYNGLIVAAFLGSTINGTIPLALGRLTGSKRAAAVRGLFLGFLVLPVGCLLTGALCGIPLSVLLHNTWPVLAVAVLLLLLFKSGSSAIGPIFNGISLAVRGLTLFGFCASWQLRSTYSGSFSRKFSVLRHIMRALRLMNASPFSIQREHTAGIPGIIQCVHCAAAFVQPVPACAEQP